MLEVMLAIVIAAGQTAPAEPKALLIGHQSVGSVSIGDSAQAIYEAFRGRSRLIDLANEGQLSPALELTFPETQVKGGVVAELWPRNNHLLVHRISVTNPRFRTAKGIGPGSTVAQLRAAYELTGVAFGEGGPFVTAKDFSGSFELDASGPRLNQLQRIRDPKQLPGDVTIVRVLVTQSLHRR